MSVAYPPFSRPGERAKQARSDELPPIARFVDELPSISEFLDALQPIEDFLYDDSAEADVIAVDLPSINEFTPPAAESVDAGLSSDDWVMDDWKAYDWSRLASIGRRSEAATAADNNWNATEWTPEPVESETPRSDSFDAHHEPTPHEVATALDEIARRIRARELTIEQFHGSPPEAAMAAALAALLRMRG